MDSHQIRIGSIKPAYVCQGTFLDLPTVGVSVQLGEATIQKAAKRLIWPGRIHAIEDLLNLGKEIARNQPAAFVTPALPSRFRDGNIVGLKRNPDFGSQSVD